MDARSLILSSLVLFALAACGGALMAGMRLRGTPRPPAWLAMGHGLLAAAGLTLLVYAAAATPIAAMALVALGLLVTAALGGVSMILLFHVRGRPLPLPLMAAHSLLAALGLGLLLWVVYG